MTPEKVVKDGNVAVLISPGFGAGFGTACVELATTHGESGLAYYLLDNAGMTLETYRASGMDADDCAVIERLFQNKG